MSLSNQMNQPNQPLKPGDSITCLVTKISLGKDSLVYVTLGYPEATNKPTLVFKQHPMIQNQDGELENLR